MSGKLGDAIAEHLGERLLDAWGGLRLDGDEYDTASGAEARARGCDEEALVLVREDGTAFEVRIEARVAALLSPAQRELAADALPPACCWVLWSPCGCAYGVTTGRSPQSGALAVTEDEAWRSLYDDWGQLEADKAAGYRIELTEWERYRRDVSPLMLAPCPHQPGQAQLPGVAG